MPLIAKGGFTLLDICTNLLDCYNFLEILKADNEIAWNLMRTLLRRMENMMNEMHMSRFAEIAGYRKSSHYIQLKNMKQDQFDYLISQNPEAVMVLLKFLSSSLAEMNEEMIRQK